MNADLQLVRSAILYADHVELISPAATMIAGLRSVQIEGLNALVALGATLDEDTMRHLVKGEPDRISDVFLKLQQFQQMNRSEKRNLDSPTRALYRHYETVLTETLAATGTDNIEQQVIASGHAELEEALQSGLLTINHNLSSEMVSEGSDRFGQLYSEVLQNLVTEGNALLLDEPMSRLANRMLQEGLLTPSATSQRRSLKAGTGTGLIARLPAFPEAHIGQVLDARDQLDVNLSRYRRAVKGYSNKLSSEAFSGELQDELDELWSDEIEPSVQEIQKQAGRSGIAKNTAWEGASAGKSVAAEMAAALIHFQAPAIGWDQVLATALAGATAVAGVTPPLMTALRTASEAKNNDLYYLAALNKRLG